MGCSGVKTYEYKYFTAYRSIRNILKDIHHLDKRIENVYLVDLDSISKFIGVFKKYNFRFIKYWVTIMKKNPTKNNTKF